MFEEEIFNGKSFSDLLKEIHTNSKKKDKHPSETAIDKCIHLCDAIVDNNSLSISQQNEQIYLAIKHLDNIPEIFPEE